MKSIEEELSNSILNIGKGPATEISQVVLSNFMDNNILKNIPIVGVISSLYEANKSVSEYKFTKKILLFLNEYNKGNVNEDKVKDMQLKFSKDIKYKTKVLEAVLVRIDRLDSDLKSKIFARLFSEYINNQYSWDEFQDLSRIIELLFISDLKLIIYLFNKNQLISIKDIKKDTTNGSIERLKTYGFLELPPETWGSISDYNLKQIKLSSEGNKFYNNCLYGLYDLNN